MASLSSVQTLLLLLAFVTPSYCMIEEGSAIEGQREFDYFALALQWPGTYCQRTRHCCSSNACCRGANAPTQFTIHGLWPDYNDGTWPACCTRSDFNEKETRIISFIAWSDDKISTLHDALDKYWPSLSCGSPSTCHGTKGSFWAHEVKVLNEAGYVPSNTEKYPLGGIVSAIENAFHATPQVVCSKHDLEELRLCFYKDFKKNALCSDSSLLQPRDCVIQNDMYTSKSSCPKYVGLPTYVSLAHVPLANQWVTAMTHKMDKSVSETPLSRSSLLGVIAIVDLGDDEPLHESTVALHK
ncbi:unnamed protein product [Dovyalis caffra]|uniref:Uncharacterized protein n=1 Tax=Dovyalis caffra TaxID=77055 RepID=A0AAV1SFC9_9ROSI|nr:unnamed protein product [Dovyalis caffra]